MIRCESRRGVSGALGLLLGGLLLLLGDFLLGLFELLAVLLELGELMVDDAQYRSESCGGHFREESQTPEGEALRKDDEFSFVSVWEYTGDDQDEELHKEELIFENVKLTQRSYK